MKFTKRKYNYLKLVALKGCVFIGFFCFVGPGCQKSCVFTFFFGFGGFKVDAKPHQYTSAPWRQGNFRFRPWNQKNQKTQCKHSLSDNLDPKNKKKQAKTQLFEAGGSERLCFHWFFLFFWSKLSEKLCFHRVFWFFGFQGRRKTSSVPLSSLTARKL